MANRKTRPFRFNTRSVVDALDGGQVPPGGCQVLTNLIFDPVNPFALQCRPAAIKQTNFTGITTPGFVSVAYVVGNICYGMIQSATTPGYDQPFAYNLNTNALVTVSGTQTAATLPLTQSSSTAWTPPTMALVGINLIVTHPGFTGGSNAFFGWFDTTNPAAPVWHAGNTTINLLPFVPTAVAQFNNRAWFVVKNSVEFTDTLALTISDATNVLTVGDSINITALASQPLVTTVQGQIQSLIVFKPEVFAIITGDAVNNDLALNINSSSVGCVAPRTIYSTPKGVMFAANDGIRTITQQGTLSEPNPDLKVPFIYALIPSRASASYNNNIYRITVQNSLANGLPKQEYWFDFRTNGWSGPHSFTQDMVTPYLNGFVAFSSDHSPGLFTSDVVQSGQSIFTELGNEMAFLFRTAPLEDDGGMFEGSAVLSVVDMQVSQVAQQYNFIASDVNHGVLSMCDIRFSSSGAIWNGFSWGAGTWTATTYGFERYNIPWTNNLVFSRLVIQITGVSLLNFKLGKLVIGNEPTQYVRKL